MDIFFETVRESDDDDEPVTFAQGRERRVPDDKEVQEFVTLVRQLEQQGMNSEEAKATATSRMEEKRRYDYQIQAYKAYHDKLRKDELSRAQDQEMAAQCDARLEEQGRRLRSGTADGTAEDRIEILERKLEDQQKCIDLLVTNSQRNEDALETVNDAICTASGETIRIIGGD